MPHRRCGSPGRRAVFAIAITILVLEIAVPAGSDDNLLQAVLDQWPSWSSASRADGC